MEPPWVGGKKVCSRHLGHITKMAAMLIYGKTLQNLLLQNRWTDFHETWYVASGLQPIIVCSNDDLGLTLTYFTARPNFVIWAFLLEKVKTVDFSETIAAGDLKVGRCDN